MYKKTDYTFSTSENKNKCGTDTDTRLCFCPGVFHSDKALSFFPTAALNKDSARRLFQSYYVSLYEYASA